MQSTINELVRNETRHDNHNESSPLALPDLDNWDLHTSENHLVSLIYRFASDPREWFQLINGLTHCMQQLNHHDAGDISSEMTKRLLPHFKEAVSICSLIAEQSNLNSIATETFEKLPVAAGITDIDGELFYLNSLASRALDPIESVEVYDNKLFLKQGTNWKPLITANQSAKTKSPQKIEHDQVTFSLLPNPSEGFIFFTIATPQNPSDSTLAPSDEVFDSYGLSEAERKIALATLKTDTAEQIAHMAGITALTVRDHLSSIYRKMDVSRKPELIQKLLTLSLFRSPAKANQSITASKELGTIESINHTLLPKTKVIVLNDGRKLSYVEHGDKKGKPLIICHNFMGSGYELPPNVYTQVEDMGLRVIVPDRPGYGDSDPLPNRDHQAWCKDLSDLLRELNIRNFSIMGHSVGGNYALTAGQYFGDRVEKVILVSPMVRFNDIQASKEKMPLSFRSTTSCVKYAPFLLKPMMDLMLRNDVESFYERREDIFSPKPQGQITLNHRLENLKEKPYFVDNIRRSVKQGTDAWVTELKLNFAPWDIELKDPKHYEIWHGDADDQIPLSMVQKMNEDLGAETFHVLEGEGHGFLMRFAPKILARLSETTITN